MLRKTLVALAATASLAVSAAALTPAMANYDFCYENPAATGCPGNYDVTKQFLLRGTTQLQGSVA